MITLGPLTIYPQGLFLLLAIVVASYLFWRGGIKAKFPEEELFDFILLTLVGGLLGGRFFYFLFAKNLTVGNFLWAFQIWRESGTLWFGAMLGGFLLGSLFAYHHRRPLLKIWDLAVLPLLLGQGLILIPNPISGSLIWGLGSLGSLYLRSFNLPDGLLLVYYLFFVSVARFVGEFWVTKKFYLGGVNVNQFFAVLLFVSGVVLWRKVFDWSDMRRIKFEGIKPIRAWLSREEKKISEQEQRLKAGDPLLEPGRTQSNPEMVAEAEEEIGHRRMEAVAAVLKGRLSQVKRALVRVKSGKYGVCETCGQTIDPARLKVDPSVTLCVDCQERKEQQTKPQGGG